MKNSSSSKIIAFFVLLCLATAASADINTAVSTSSDLSSLFQIAPNDLSVFVLMHIFGSVGQVLPGDYLLTGEIFQYFNVAILSVTVLVPVTWVVLRSVMETAHEGQFLGKKLHSIWVPIRISLAMALLAPIGGAYSFIQIVIMWGVLQGIGAADTLWQVSLQYLTVNHGFVYSSYQAPTSSSGGYSSTSAAPANNLGWQVLAGLTCMAQTYKDSHPSMDYDSAPTLLPTRDTLQNVSSQGDTVATWYKYDFNTPRGDDPNTGQAYLKLSGDCGYVYIPKYDEIYPQANSAPFDSSTVAYQRALSTETAVEGSLDNLAETAKYLAYQDDKTAAISSMNSAAGNPIAVVGSYVNSSIYAATEGIAEQNAWNSDSSDSGAQQYQTDYMYGWAYAGALYYKFLKSMVSDTSSSTSNVQEFSADVAASPQEDCGTNNCQLSPAINTSTTGNKVSVVGNDSYFAVCADPSTLSVQASNYEYTALGGTSVGDSGSQDNRNSVCKYLFPLYQNANAVLGLTASSTVNPGDVNDATNSDQTLKQAAVILSTKYTIPTNDLISLAFFLPLSQTLKNTFQNLVYYSAITGGVSSSSSDNSTNMVFSTLASLGVNIAATSSQVISPMQLAVQMGAGILHGLKTATTFIVHAVFILAMLSGWCSAQSPLWAGFFSGLLMFLPVIFMTLSALYMVGFMLADYLPLVPFIIFFFATTGWVFAVIECIVAAPIAALGMTFPEGHDLFGGAKAIMEFVLSVCLTPVLIIVGYFVSIYAMFALVGLLNMLFGTAFANVIAGRTYQGGVSLGNVELLANPLNSGNLTTFDEIFFLAVYAYMVVFTVHKCCTFGIEKMPVGVLRVLGFSGGGLREYMGGERETAGVAKQSADTMGKTSEGMGKGGQGMSESMGKGLGAERKAKLDEEKKKDDDDDSGGGGTRVIGGSGTG